MNGYMKYGIIGVVAGILLMVSSYMAGAGWKVSDPQNKHNLSNVASPGISKTYKATSETEICVFCHTPHNSKNTEVAPLWNREFSTQTFQRYTTRYIQGLAAAKYGQPNGSSKLCLSCHDGVSSLGTVLSRPNPIQMTSDVISGIASFNPSTKKMRYGHHPVSFVYASPYSYTRYPEAQSGVVIGGLPGTYIFPTLTQGAPPVPVVKLKQGSDGNGWMQCTTCHDAHENHSDDASAQACYDATGIGGSALCDGTNRKKAPLWVYGGVGTAAADRDAVCTTCHSLKTSPWPVSPIP